MSKKKKAIVITAPSAVLGSFCAAPPTVTFFHEKLVLIALLTTISAGNVFIGCLIPPPWDRIIGLIISIGLIPFGISMVTKVIEHEKL